MNTTQTEPKGSARQKCGTIEASRHLQMATSQFDYVTKLEARNSDLIRQREQVIEQRDTLEAQRDQLRAACKALFEHCAMTHKHWGEGCNQKQSDAAQASALAAIASAEGK